MGLTCRVGLKRKKKNDNELGHSRESGISSPDHLCAILIPFHGNDSELGG